MEFKHQWGKMSVVDEKETRPTKHRAVFEENWLCKGNERTAVTE